MDKTTTPSFTSSFNKPNDSGNATSGECPQPSGRTLAFLRSFARNYRVIPQLPQGLQGIILG